MSTSRSSGKSLRQNQLKVRNGAIPPSAQVLHFSDTQWEDFIEAAVINKSINGNNYVQVKRLGNAGDAGRDVEARLIHNLEENKWDLYQAKHYENRLAPSTAFPELVKFFGHLYKKTYPFPRKYYFCAPKNCGPQLHDLLAAPAKFKATFISAWESGESGLKDFIPLLTNEMREFVQAFDFEKIEEVLVRDLIALHSINSKEHFELFGIEAERGDDPDMPAAPTADEFTYVSELLSVYTEHNQSTISLANIDSSEIYRDHLDAARATFYCAEGLRRFSRDIYSEDEFDNLLNMIYKGIRPMVLSPKLQDGFDRLEAAIRTVSTLNINDSKLFPRIRGGDLPGTCHHLVNEKKLRWVK